MFRERKSRNKPKGYPENYPYKPGTVLFYVETEPEYNGPYDVYDEGEKISSEVSIIPITYVRSEWFDGYGSVEHADYFIDEGETQEYCIRKNNRIFKNQCDAFKYIVKIAANTQELIPRAIKNHQEWIDSLNEAPLALEILKKEYILKAEG